MIWTPYFPSATLIHTVGYLGIFLIVFADSGLLLGLVLPGDSLLFTAGQLTIFIYTEWASIMASATPFCFCTW